MVPASASKLTSRLHSLPTRLAAPAPLAPTCPSSTATAGTTRPASSSAATRYACSHPGQIRNQHGSVPSQPPAQGQGDVLGKEPVGTPCLTQLVPKPSETNRFCMVCKQQFDDYLTVLQPSFSTSPTPPTRPTSGTRPSTLISSSSAVPVHPLPPRSPTRKYARKGPKNQNARPLEAWEPASPRRAPRLPREWCSCW